MPHTPRPRQRVGLRRPLRWAGCDPAACRGAFAPVARVRLPGGGEHSVEFSHSLDEQIGDQLRTGFLLIDLFEDRDSGSPATGRSRFMPVLFASRAMKPR